MSGDKKRNRIALRMDDIGASSKHFEVYSKFPLGLGNILFLKYLPGFRAWGKYNELDSDEVYKLFELLEKYNACLTLGITASWVEYSGKLVPINKKYPDLVNTLNFGLKKKIIKIASHGLTHCVLQDYKFRPKLFTGNRTYHREFWDYLPYETHFEHIQTSKKILEDSFNQKIEMLIPPGNVYSDKTVKAAVANGINYINCNTQSENRFGCKILSNENIIAFHDRELKLFGLGWLENILKSYDDRTLYKFVDEL